MVAPALFSSAKVEWSTPPELFRDLHTEFDFNLDVCANASNAKCLDWFGPDHPDETKRDGITQEWGLRRCWMNPPHGRGIGAWMDKAVQSARLGATVVCLVPSRTDTKWWHQSVIRGGPWEVRFVRGRLKFGGSKNRAPFPSAVIIYRPPDWITG